MADPKEPSNAEIITALQGMWRQQKDLIQGVEGRLGDKIDGAEQRLDGKLAQTEQRLREEVAATEQRLGERMAQEIQDRPIVVHVDMTRVSELEKRLEALLRRVEELESHTH